MMRTIFPKAAFFAAVFLLSVESSSACSCGPAAFAPACQKIGQTDVAFLGRSAEWITSASNAGYYRFEVEKVYKGIEPGTKEVLVWAGGGTSCSTVYRVGRRYLMFGGSIAPSDGRGRPTVSSPTCSGSREASPPEIAVLDDWLAGKTRTFVSGRVLQSKPSWGFPSYEDSTPVANSDVILRRNGTDLVARSGENGSFVFDSIPPGAYLLLASKSPFSPFGGESVSVEKGTCAYVFPELRANSFIEGRVVDDMGRPVKHVRVRGIRRDASGGWRQPHNAWDESDANGRFRLDGIDSGDYILGVETYKGGPSDDSPFPPTYFPGVANQSEARVVVVEPQNGISGILFRLLPRHTPRTVRIRILNADGKRIGDNLLQLFSGNGLIWNFEKGYNEGREFETGFRFHAYAEREYVFKARYWLDDLTSDVDNKRLLIAEPVALKPGRRPAEIVLRLSKMIHSDDMEIRDY
jgi:hypothetical protein